MRFRYWLFYHILRDFYLKNVDVVVNGLDNIPRNEGFIIASNHDHKWDPVVISLSIKKHIHFFAVHDEPYSGYQATLSKNRWLCTLEKFVFRGSFFGIILKLLQQMPISHTNKLINKSALLSASHYITKKEIIGIFPEGEPQLREKKVFPGAAILAKNNNCKILPVYVSNNAPSGDFDKMNFTRACVNIGTPLKFSTSINVTKKMVMKEIYKLKND